MTRVPWQKQGRRARATRRCRRGSAGDPLIGRLESMADRCPRRRVRRPYPRCGPGHLHDDPGTRRTLARLHAMARQRSVVMIQKCTWRRGAPPSLRVGPTSLLRVRAPLEATFGRSGARHAGAQGIPSASRRRAAARIRSVDPSRDTDGTFEVLIFFVSTRGPLPLGGGGTRARPLQPVAVAVPVG